MLILFLAAQAGPPPSVPVPTPPVCSVTLTVAVDEAGDPLEVQEYRYDGEAKSWSYLSYDGGPPPPEEARQFEKQGRDGGDRSDDPVPPAGYYADSASKLGAGWAPMSATDGYGMRAYGLDDLPKGTVVANGRDLSGSIRLRYLIDEAADPPLIAVAAGSLRKAWRIPLIARIDAFDIARRYAPAGPETGAAGVMLPVSEHVEIAADVLGKDRSAVLDTTFTDWDCRPADAG